MPGQCKSTGVICVFGSHSVCDGKLTVYRTTAVWGRPYSVDCWWPWRMNLTRTWDVRWGDTFQPVVWDPGLSRCGDLVLGFTIRLCDMCFCASECGVCSFFWCFFFVGSWSCTRSQGVRFCVWWVAWRGIKKLALWSARPCFAHRVCTITIISSSSKQFSSHTSTWYIYLCSDKVEFILSGARARLCSEMSFFVAFFVFF